MTYCFVVETAKAIEDLCHDRCPGCDVLGLCISSQFGIIRQDVQTKPALFHQR